MYKVRIWCGDENITIDTEMPKIPSVGEWVEFFYESEVYSKTIFGITYIFDDENKYLLAEIFVDQD